MSTSFSFFQVFCFYFIIVKYTRHTEKLHSKGKTDRKCLPYQGMGHHEDHHESEANLDHTVCSRPT